MIAIILLVALYIATFVVSFFVTKGGDNRIFAVCLFGTIAIPLLAYLLILVFGRVQGKHIMGDPDPIEVPNESLEDEDNFVEDDSPEATETSTTSEDV